MLTSKEVVPYFWGTRRESTPLIEMHRRPIRRGGSPNLDKKRRTREKLQRLYQKSGTQSPRHFQEMLPSRRHLGLGALGADGMPTAEDPLPAQEASFNPKLRTYIK